MTHGMSAVATIGLTLVMNVAPVEQPSMNACDITERAASSEALLATSNRNSGFLSTLTQNLRGTLREFDWSDYTQYILSLLHYYRSLLYIEYQWCVTVAMTLPVILPGM